MSEFGIPTVEAHSHDDIVWGSGAIAVDGVLREPDPWQLQDVAARAAIVIAGRLDAVVGTELVTAADQAAARALTRISAELRGQVAQTPNLRMVQARASLNGDWNTCASLGSALFSPRLATPNDLESFTARQPRLASAFDTTRQALPVARKYMATQEVTFLDRVKTQRRLAATGAVEPFLITDGLPTGHRALIIPLAPNTVATFAFDNDLPTTFSVSTYGPYLPTHQRKQSS